MGFFIDAERMGSVRRDKSRVEGQKRRGEQIRWREAGLFARKKIWVKMKRDDKAEGRERQSEGTTES